MNDAGSGDGSRELPKRGARLSYSAGTTDLSPRRYRVITSSSNRATQILAAFPLVSSFLGAGELVLVNNYPASLGHFEDVIQVDTFLRAANFSRALLLAAQAECAAVVAGQPFAVAQLLHQHLETDEIAEVARRLPARVLLVLGGYACPMSLEDWICSRVAGAQSQALVLHAFGAAEADFACMVGLRNRATRAIEYHPIPDAAAPTVVDGTLVLVGNAGAVATGDLATVQDGAWFIHPPESRYPRRIAALHESWDLSDWDRLTGYATMSAGASDPVVTQLRPGAVSRGPAELPFHRFFEMHGGWLSEKPRYLAQRDTR